MIISCDDFTEDGVTMEDKSVEMLYRRAERYSEQFGYIIHTSPTPIGWFRQRWRMTMRKPAVTNVDGDSP